MFGMLRRAPTPAEVTAVGTAVGTAAAPSAATVAAEILDTAIFDTPGYDATV